MNNLTNITPTLVRVWPDSTTSGVNDMKLSLVYDESIALDAERCDAYYSQWAASDFPGPFYNYVKIWESNGRNHKTVDLTPEDLAIFHARWRKPAFPMYHSMLEGDRHDTEIFALLAECSAANGGRTKDVDYAYVEEGTYVYWVEQMDPSCDFDPIIIS